MSTARSGVSVTRTRHRVFLALETADSRCLSAEQFPGANVRRVATDGTSLVFSDPDWIAGTGHAYVVPLQDFEFDLPLWQPILFGSLGGAGTWELLYSHANPALSGLSVDLLSLTISSAGKVVLSNQENLQLQ